MFAHVLWAQPPVCVHLHLWLSEPIHFAHPDKTALLISGTLVRCGPSSPGWALSYRKHTARANTHWVWSSALSSHVNWPEAIGDRWDVGFVFCFSQGLFLRS